MATPDAVGEAPRGDAVPKPRQRAASYSGRLLLRMPAGLHGELARAADREGVSLNQFISNALAGAVGWGRDESGVTPTASAPKTRSRWLMFLLAANLVLVAAAAIAAIVFLVAAWVTS
jgi:hypothetical protein